MNVKNPFHHISYRMVYIRYRFIVVPLGLIVSSIILMVLVVFPQFQDFERGRRQQEDLKKQNEKLQQNIQILSAMDDSTLSSYVSVALSALPLTKDYIGILGAISTAAGESGTGLSDFSFRVGDVASGSAQVVDPIVIKLQVQGPLSSLQQFVASLSESLPLSEISAISINGNTMNLEITFLYKPPVKPQLGTQTNLKPLSRQELSLMSELSSWSNGKEVVFSGAAALPSLFDSSASSSAEAATGSAVPEEI